MKITVYEIQHNIGSMSVDFLSIRHQKCKSKGRQDSIDYEK